MNDIIKAKLELLPSSPGVYKMIDKRGEIIYVGKALSLKNRVRQYFQSSRNHPPKVIALVAHIEDFETILTSSETEALTLESNLIKAYQPRYNILLKDDKHFPYVRVDLRQDFPRFEVVRRVSDDGARYLGPFLSSYALNDALNVVRDYFPVRNCKKDIKKAISRRERPCLMSHVGKCMAPCSGLLTREEYHAVLYKVIDFLNGDTDEVVKKLTGLMDEAAESLEFEKAARLRDHISAVSIMGKKQAAILNKGVEQDVFACCSHNSKKLVFGLFVRGGKVVGTDTFSFERASDSSDAELMAAFLKQYYMDAALIPPEVLLYSPAADMDLIENWLSGARNKRVRIAVPQRGEKKGLVDLAYRNGVDTLIREDSLKKRAWERGEGALVALCAAIGLEEIPTRMECFDNSHIQGRDTVSSMVVFINGAPAKSEYRRFRIKTETNGDDYAAMQEALRRRFNRARQGDERFAALPELLVLDGGRTQLNVALDVLNEFGLSEIPAIALAELSGAVYLPGEEEPLRLKKDSPEQHILERLRDEAHRFAISYHRGLRGKNALYSRLDEISGVGEKRKRLLFDAFPTMDSIAAASLDELKKIKGIDAKTAKAVWEYFHKGDND